MGRGKRRGGLSSLFPLPIVPSRFLFSPQPPTAQGGLCGGERESRVPPAWLGLESQYRVEYVVGSTL